MSKWWNCTFLIPNPRPTHTRAKMNNLINVVNNLLQCCAAHCSTMLCCTLSTTVVNNRCSQLFTFNNHCSIIVDNDQQAFFINYYQLMFWQHCNNYCSLSASNNYWSNNTQHCEFNKCYWTLITTLFRRCSTKKIASTWSIFARVPWTFNLIWWQCLDLELTPTEIYDVTWNPRIGVRNHQVKFVLHEVVVLLEVMNLKMARNVLNFSIIKFSNTISFRDKKLHKWAKGFWAKASFC